MMMMMMMNIISASIIDVFRILTPIFKYQNHDARARKMKLFHGICDNNCSGGVRVPWKAIASQASQPLADPKHLSWIYSRASAETQNCLKSSTGTARAVLDAVRGAISNDFKNFCCLKLLFWTILTDVWRILCIYLLVVFCLFPQHLCCGSPFLYPSGKGVSSWKNPFLPPLGQQSHYKSYCSFWKHKRRVFPLIKNYKKETKGSPSD